MKLKGILIGKYTIQLYQGMVLVLFTMWVLMASRINAGIMAQLKAIMKLILIVTKTVKMVL